MIRDASEADFPAIVQLNAASVQFTSPMTPARLAQLAADAALLRVVDDAGVQAFLLVFREGAAYDSPNYRWFASRYERFLYIDRIVVAEAARGAGWGRRLYEDLFRFAGRAGVPVITCEFDVDPPNPVSERFHRAFGFSEVGQHRYGAASKLVSLQAVTCGAAGCSRPPA